jgi:hypothetical protein
MMNPFSLLFFGIIIDTYLSVRDFILFYFIYLVRYLSSWAGDHFTRRRSQIWLL